MAVKTIICSKCGGNIDLIEGMDNIFCLYCGTQYVFTNPLSKVGLICLSCSVRNKEDSIFCSKCGSKLQEECPFCNRMHPYDTVYCPAAGHNIKLLTQLDKKFETSMEEDFWKLEELFHNNSQVMGVTSGYEEFDRLTTGFYPGELIIVASRPGMGKTNFALNIARFVSKKLSVAIFSLEKSKEYLLQCLISSRSMSDAHRIKKGHLNSDNLTEFTRVMAELSEARIYIDDTPGISIVEMKAKSQRLKMRKDIQLIIIDYLQLISSTKNVTRKKQVADISKGLKILAMKLSIPVIALCQLSTAVDNRTDRRPHLYDLRETGVIEQYADMVTFIYCDDYYNSKSDRGGIAEVIIAKQRHGILATAELLYLK